MRVSDDFVLRQVADEYLLIPVGQAALRVNGMISVSESGFLLYQKLKTGCAEQELVDLLLSEYEVGEVQAREDVAAFLSKMRALGMLEEIDQ